MTPAEHPMPDRLYEMMLELNLKWLTIMADSDGVGLNKLQFTTRISICKTNWIVSQAQSECLQLPLACGK